MAGFSKLQTRAKVTAFMSELKTLKGINEGCFERFVADLSEIDDKKALFDIFIKEFIKLDNDLCNIASFVIKEVVPSDYIGERAVDMIKNEPFSDEIKYKLLQLMRLTGIPRDFNELPEYFDDPKKIIDSETGILLENAVYNPESALDFLDFTAAMSDSDRRELVKSLAADYSDEKVANIISPILYSDFKDDLKHDIVKILGDSKASVAIPAINYVMRVSDDSEILKSCSNALKKLKFAGCSEEKAELEAEKFNEGAECAEFYTTIPDGAGNQAFLVSRHTSDNKFNMAAIVINDITGVKDAFGFYKISLEELEKIIAKFYVSEGNFAVSPEYAQFRISKAVETTIRKKRPFPYEFICWKPLLAGIANTDVFAGELYSNVNRSADEVLEFLTKKYTFSWFLTENNTDEIRNTVDAIYNDGVADIAEINKIVKEGAAKTFDEEDEKCWKDRLLNLAYLLKISDKEYDGATAFCIAENPEYFELFKQIIFQRSIVNFIVAQLHELKKPAMKINIFGKKNEKAAYDAKKLEKIFGTISSDWIKE